MATIPIVNSRDKRVGIIVSTIVLLLVFILSILFTYEIADPPPVIPPLTVTEPLDQTIIENIVIESGGSSGGGNPSSDPKNNEPQTENVLTSDKSDASVNDGKGNTTTTHNSQADPSGDETDDPFAGGQNGGAGGGKDGVIGKDDGEGDGEGSNSGHGAGGRKVVKEVDISRFTYNTTEYIHLNVYVNGNGDVTRVQNVINKTTTTDVVLIRKVMNAVKAQVKFTKATGAPTIVKSYVVKISAQ